MKKTLSMLFAILLLTLTMSTALAGNMPPADQIAPSGSARLTWSNPCRSATDELTINYWECSIEPAGNAVYVYAATYANKVCDFVGGAFEVERWEDNQWKIYRAQNYLGYRMESYDFGGSFAVEPGYYYRLVSYHEACLGDEYKALQATTRSIYVN